MKKYITINTKFSLGSNGGNKLHNYASLRQTEGDKWTVAGLGTFVSDLSHLRVLPCAAVMHELQMSRIIYDLKSNIKSVSLINSSKNVQ